MHYVHCDEVFLLSAALARVACEQSVIAYQNRGFDDLAELHNDLAMLVGLVETELELGVDGDVYVELPSKEGIIDGQTL